jgi:hypothetical protein
MFKKMLVSVSMVLLISGWACYADTYTGETSNRVKINLGQTPWKFIKSDPANTPQAPAYNDAGWKDVGIPHCWNDTDTFINQVSGGGDGSMYGGTNWYRKHFTLDNAFAGRKIYIEFEGAHVGASVYVNGQFIPGNSAYNPLCTHVIGFMGFVIDATQWVQFGGADNVIAVRLSKNGATYADPGIALGFRFGQADGGLFRPVWMHITDNVHIPMNVYSVLNKWGTYVATTTVAADGSSAAVRILTNVENDGGGAASVTLTTKIVDAANNVVWTQDNTSAVNSGSNHIFDQTTTIVNPHLWYPNASIYGTPYMYKVYHIVKVGGTTLDVAQSPLGIRRITWDADFPYINGHKHVLWGASARYDYPALGTALPPEVEYRDAKILADAGGRLWRPGHSSCSPGFVEACDAYGIMLIQPSGEGEGAFSTGANATAYTKGLKLELHRDMVIRDRNNPSILAWEASNGDIDPAFATLTRNVSNTWDSLAPRAQSCRGGPGYAVGDLIACTLTGCDAQQKPFHPQCPWWGAESWGRQSSRAAYDYEIWFAAEFLRNWSADLTNTTHPFGICQWYLAETPGEVGNFPEGGSPRSFGSSMTDFNRLPKMLYKIYSAAWLPFSVKPVVFLDKHWNRAGAVSVNAFSNCPSVRLLINGATQGTKTPNTFAGTNNQNDISQTTTQMPFQCNWNVTWATGTLRAEGLDAGGNVVCFDEKKTAGAPACVVLVQDPPIVKPNGEVFNITANGTDAALIVAKVVDANGILCPLATNIVHFTVSALGNYRGGTDQFVTAGQPLGYHSPLDPELSAEGGMCKVAVRSTFTTGVVTVTATSPNLCQGQTSFTVHPVNEQVSIVPSKFQTSGTMETALKTGMAGSTLRYFISRPSFVTVEILSASGRILRRIPGSKQADGWHSIQLAGMGNRNDNAGAGVYFARFSIDGNYQSVKRIFVIR